MIAKKVQQESRKSVNEATDAKSQTSNPSEASTYLLKEPETKAGLTKC
jgi:hypothetical protein